MKQDKTRKKGLFSLIREYGFTFLLAATVVAVGIIGSVAMLTPEEPEKTPTPTPQPQTQQHEDKPSVKPDPEDPVHVVEPEPQKEDEPVVVVDPEPEPKYALPLDAKASLTFSGTVPVFSSTLQEWHMHQGVDFTTESPELVQAVMDGTVEDVYKDDLYGNTVVIKQVDGITAVYQSLDDVVRVKKGQIVKTGDYLGRTGTSAESECADGIHLHLCMVENGAYIDPLAKINE